MNWAQSLNGAHGARRGRSEPQEKNSLSKRARSGPQVLARGSGPGMEKPDPLPFLGTSIILIVIMFFFYFFDPLLMEDFLHYIAHFGPS